MFLLRKKEKKKEPNTLGGCSGVGVGHKLETLKLCTTMTIE